MIRGRSFTLDDIWTGAEIWRFSAADSTGSTDLRSQLGTIPSAASLFDKIGRASCRERV